MENGGRADMPERHAMLVHSGDNPPGKGIDAAGEWSRLGSEPADPIGERAMSTNNVGHGIDPSLKAAIGGVQAAALAAVGSELARD